MSPEIEDEFLPLFLKSGHVFLTQHALQAFVTGGILAHVGGEFLVELNEKLLFLEVIAEVTGLSIEVAVFDGLVTAIELSVTHRRQLLEGNRFAGLDGLLEPLEAPIDQTADVAVFVC